MANQHRQPPAAPPPPPSSASEGGRLDARPAAQSVPRPAPRPAPRLAPSAGTTSGETLGKTLGKTSGPQPPSGEQPAAPPWGAGLRRWATHFFQPCPQHILRTLAGSALAALLVGVLWFGGTLAIRGGSATLPLLPYWVTDTLSALSSLQPFSGHTAEESTQYGQYEQPGQSPPPSGKDGENGGAGSTVLGAPANTPRPAMSDLTDTLPLWRSGIDSYVRRPLRDDALPYSEAPDAPLAEAVKQIDFALLQVVQRLHLDPNSIQMIRYMRRQSGSAPSGGTGYLFQQLRCYLPPGMSTDAFVATVNEQLDVWSERATMVREPVRNGQPERLTIAADAQPTHELFLSPLHRQLPLPPTGVPLLTIVIDDLGDSPETAQRLLELGVPLTLSIWPRAAHAATVANMAWKAGQEVLIHQPAEPLGAPKVQTGPGAVRTAMTDQEIADTVAAHVSLVPHATGLNNHMGSRFTMDTRCVTALSAASAAHGLFVLDSLTHQRSVFARTAADMHVTTYRRAIFLDDPLDPVNIRRALTEADRLARTHGQAIAIGHPHPETIDALRDWLRTRTSDVKLVPLRALRPLVGT